MPGFFALFREAFVITSVLLDAMYCSQLYIAPFKDDRKYRKLQEKLFTKSLSQKDAAIHPIQQFSKWWDEVVASEIDEVNSITPVQHPRMLYPANDTLQ